MKQAVIAVPMMVVECGKKPTYACASYRSVRASIIGGEWAVHRAVDYQAKGWTVTLVRIGMAIAHVRTKAKAVEIARRANAIQYDWSKLPSEHTAAIAFLRRRLKRTPALIALSELARAAR